VIYSEESQDEEGSIWYEIPLDGSGSAVEVYSDVDIGSVYADPDTGNMIGYFRNGANGGRVFFDEESQRRSRLIERTFASPDLAFADWTPGLGRTVLRTSGEGDSGTWYMIDLDERKAEPIGMERPSVTAEFVGPISVFDFTAADGLEMDGILTLPPGREPTNLPVVIFPHGGPASHDSLEFHWWAQAFASRGYAVFQPNFRGSTNHGPAFQQAGRGEWGRKMQSDISDGLAALSAEGIVDPDRACIMGGSYGGYAALAGVTLQQGLYRCSVAVAPVSDLRLLFQTEYDDSGDSGLVRRALRENLGPISELNDVSPRRSADQADAPILLIHGRDDTVVPFEQSTVMANALRSADKPYRLVELESEDHWLSRSETRKQMLEEAMEFVLEHNPPD
jgi:dipeptidyl aminopeptidase/acylaminoacyl peptidase